MYLYYFFSTQTLLIVYIVTKKICCCSDLHHTKQQKQISDIENWTLFVLHATHTSNWRGDCPLPPSVFVLGSGPPWKNLFRGKSWNQLGTILIDRTPSIRSYLMYDATSCILLLQLIKKKLWERKRKLQ